MYGCAIGMYVAESSFTVNVLFDGCGIAYRSSTTEALASGPPSLTLYVKLSPTQPPNEDGTYHTRLLWRRVASSTTCPAVSVAPAESTRLPKAGARVMVVTRSSSSGSNEPSVTKLLLSTTTATTGASPTTGAVLGKRVGRLGGCDGIAFDVRYVMRSVVVDR
eukprot:5523995-Prymnesium_polylepis.1